MEKSTSKFLGTDFPCYKGIILPDFPDFKADVEKKMTEIKNFPSRKSDILLCCSMKSGTHWLLEIISMLLSSECRNTTDTFVGSNVEITPVDMFSKRPDPRIIQSHLPYMFLPAKHIEMGYKIVFAMRNPKDRLVSFFHMMKGAKVDFGDIQWSDFFAGNVKDNDEPEVYGSWFDYTRQWEAAIQQNHNIYPIYYEDLKKDFISSVEKLATFLGTQRDAAFYKTVEEKCSFTFMKQNKDNDVWNISPSVKTYRKGEIGDWKNYFTVAQNEHFDALYRKKMKGSKLRFRFE